MGSEGFLASHQLADGAILGPGDEINPYFANLAAIGLARAKPAGRQHGGLQVDAVVLEPPWDTDNIPDSYPWTSMARAAQLMGDSAGATMLLTTLENKYAPSWGGNWYDDEAGWFLLAATATNP
jgi:hypothetical protein